jgi:hypothetical protein
MKVTTGLAMRARDVSRPRPGQLADAAAREESVPPRVRLPRNGTAAAGQAQSRVPRPAPPARQAPVPGRTGDEKPQAQQKTAAPERTPEPGEPRVRQRKRRRR